MHITGAFLAEHAEIVDQKLNVTGGVLDTVHAPKAGQFNDKGEMLVGTLYIVTLMQSTADDHEKSYHLKTELVDPDGNTHLLLDNEIAVDAHTGENRFYVSLLTFAAPSGGRITFLQSIDDGDPVAVPVQLIVE